MRGLVALLYGWVLTPAVVLAQTAQNTDYGARTRGGTGWAWFWLIVALIVVVSFLWGGRVRRRGGPPATRP